GSGGRQRRARPARSGLRACHAVRIPPVRGARLHLARRSVAATSEAPRRKRVCERRGRRRRRESARGVRNKVQLITYADRLGGTLQGLRALLEGPFEGLFGAVHVLPFFHPIDGADAGFDPIDHTQVDARLGSWDDVRALVSAVVVMADVIVNHISSCSPQFLDFAANGDGSRYAGMFLTLDGVFSHGAHESDLLAIYRPRP